MTNANSTADFQRIAANYLSALYQAQPVMATAMGVHDYDDRLPSLAPYAIAADLHRARGFLHEIDRISLSSLSGDARIDSRIARMSAQCAIADMEHARPFERQPGAAVEVAVYGVYLLLQREFTDIQTRGVAAMSRLRGFAGLLADAAERLSVCPKLFVEMGLESIEGATSFLNESVPAFATELGSDGLATALLRANSDALEALATYEAHVRAYAMPRAIAEFGLGAEAYEYRLSVGHLLDYTALELQEIGREAVAQAQSDLAAMAEQIEPGKDWRQIVSALKQVHPEAGSLRQAYADQMERARAFVEERRLVDSLSDESLEVVDTPPFAQNVLPYAAYVPSAPFEQKQRGLFWVTPIPDSAPESEKIARLEGHSIYRLPIIALHEAYPGHHLQMSTANRHVSRFRRHFGDSNLFIEGWALYCEEMMFEEGFYSDPRVRLMQLKDVLWRAARVVVDPGLHALGMTFDQAVQYLVEEAALEEPMARAEVRRYALTPTQPMTYLIGKQQILELRAWQESRLGSGFNLRSFHNMLLSYGSVPPRLIREDLAAVP